MIRFKNRIYLWLKQLPLVRHLKKVKAPRDLNYFYTFGGILIFMLTSQILTGFVLALHYVPYVSEAFSSIEFFIRQEAFGWLFRPWHAIGASFFFIAAYIHIGRGLYYGSYKKPRSLNWILGIIIYWIMLITAFLGHVLVWGQSSYMSATVVSNFFLAVPFIGDHLKNIFIGGYELNQATLSRFYLLHLFLPFLIVALVFRHVKTVHKKGQTHPKEGRISKKILVPFYPYILIKDVLAIVVFLIFFTFILFYLPEAMMDSENYAPADPLKPVLDIYPQWYFLPFYALIKGLNFNLGPLNANVLGVWSLFFSIFILILVPKFDQSGPFVSWLAWIYRICFWFFIADFVLLGWLGTQELTERKVLYIQLLAIYYFCFFILILPVLSFFNNRYFNQQKRKRFDER